MPPVAITIYEAHQSRDLKVNRETTDVPVKFVVTGTTDEVAVYDAVMFATSPTMYGLVRKDIDARLQGGDLWHVTLTYQRGNPSEALQPSGPEGPGTQSGEEPPQTAPGPDDPLGAGFDFSTGGGTAHILLSKETVESRKPGGGAAPESQRAIGLTAEGVTGCDIIAAAPQFTITRRRRVVTRRYFDALCRLTAKTNRSEFWGFKPGELLYTGANGSGDPRDAEVTHHFTFAENYENGDPRNQITPDIELTEKKGHEFVWAVYSPRITGDALYSRPVAVYRERVYDEGDFSQLEIGV
jgi:hypothetical protein